MSDAPIGVFDSGVGGLTVARAILDQLPHEPLLYFGDTAHAPYGPRPIAEIRRLALAAMDTLVADGVKLLVIACNTASAACLRDARERYDVPVVEVVLPAARRAVAASRSGRVGVIGTSATITSRAYDDAVAAAGVTLTSVACPAFVDFVERGTTAGRQLLGLTEAYLAPLQEAGVDTLILGCTHYPLLTGVISLVMGEGVTLVSSAEETAKDTYRVLARGGLFRDPDLPAPAHRFLATGDPRSFTRVGRRFLGPELGAVLPGQPVGGGTRDADTSGAQQPLPVSMAVNTREADEGGEMAAVLATATATAEAVRR
ncbi:glutamate racemase [Frankia sp. CNm7]|uniref:Glutamate racemase n=1 Tax=Frankia nepalensis TaxID=1836974 RepID=A0A937UP22_9ACTN|nr:glutamate racemase [Frankia nepalensis]MBL7495547.1 glutamate racemase [Frankia nepalensis]MBL7509828.1 glutamate racemase [Frankia nepalensis]MBL7517507.1 glutamate racemase [Frankia nepalensis]MBL7626820.1 glutamate racemase [Frankia nepalensis]